MSIKNNPSQLTESEKHFLIACKWYSYTYGVGLIFLPNGSWSCTDSVGARDFLKENKVPERF